MRLLFATLFFAATSQASVQAYLEKDPIVFYIQDEDGNADATSLFYNLNVEQRGQGTFQKEFTTMSGNFSMSCSYSQTNLKSDCIVRVKKTAELDMSNQYYVIYQPKNTDDAREIYSKWMKDSEGFANFYYSARQELFMHPSENQFTLYFSRSNLPIIK